MYFLRIKEKNNIPKIKEKCAKQLLKFISNSSFKCRTGNTHNGVISLLNVQYEREDLKMNGELLYL